MVLPRNLLREKARCCGCLQDEWKTAHQNREQLKYAKINELEEEDVLTIHYIWPIFSIPTALHQLMWWLRILAGLEFWLRQLKDLYSLSLRLSLSKMYCLNHYHFTIKVLISSKANLWCRELTHWERPQCWERLKAGREGGDRGWEGWMASLTQWT